MTHLNLVLLHRQCWFRQYLARQVLYLKLAEADYINRMLNKKRWDQVGMVVVPNKYIRQYLRCAPTPDCCSKREGSSCCGRRRAHLLSPRSVTPRPSPAQEATLRRTASRNFLIRQKRTRRVFRRAYKARQRDALLATRRSGRGLTRGASDSGFDSVYSLSDEEDEPGTGEQLGWGAGKGRGLGKAARVAKRTRGGGNRAEVSFANMGTLFEGDSFVGESAFMPGLAERPCVATQCRSAGLRRVHVHRD